MLGIRRREFITLLGGTVARPFAVFAARAQQGNRARRIGVLMSGARDAADWQHSAQGDHPAPRQDCGRERSTHGRSGFGSPAPGHELACGP